MKKVFLSILFAGIATFANAQKNEVAEAKRLWGIFQFTMSQDPDTKTKQAPASGQSTMPPAAEGSEMARNRGNVGARPGAARPGGGAPATPAGPKLTFLEKQINSLKEGLSHTDKAVVHEKTKNSAEAWLYKALFSSSIAYLDSLNLNNALKYQADAEAAIEQTEKLDTKGEFKSDLSIATTNVRNAIVARGLRAYNNKDYNAAYNYFVEVTQKNPSDTSMYMNAGIIGKMAGKYTEAIDNFRKLVSFNVPDSKNFYVEMINIATENLKDTVKALEIVKEATAKFPDDPQLIGAETDIYINKGDIGKSQDLLQKLIAKDPNKSVYQFLMGETYYRQALLMQTERNKIDAKKVKEYDAITAKMVALIDKALPFYQKSMELDPKFEPALEALKQIYGFKNDTANFNDVKKKLDDLRQN